MNTLSKNIEGSKLNIKQHKVVLDSIKQHREHFGAKSRPNSPLVECGWLYDELSKKANLIDETSFENDNFDDWVEDDEIGCASALIYVDEQRKTFMNYYQEIVDYLEEKIVTEPDVGEWAVGLDMVKKDFGGIYIKAAEKVVELMCMKAPIINLYRASADEAELIRLSKLANEQFIEYNTKIWPKQVQAEVSLREQFEQSEEYLAEKARRQNVLEKVRTIFKSTQLGK